MRALLIVDDRKIRKNAFAEAEALIKKIDQLGVDLESFKAKDQRLFSSWYDLTFQDTQRILAERRDELHELMKLHNWMIALSQQLGLSLPEAFALVEDEARRYKQASGREKTEIENLRRERDEFIEEEIGAQESYDDDGFHDEPEFNERAAHHENGARKRDEFEERQFRGIADLNDDLVRMTCATSEGAHELLGTLLRLMRSDADFPVFIRIWDLTAPRFQKAFAKTVASQTGIHLFDVIHDMRLRAAEHAKTNFTDPDINEDESDINFDDEDLDDFVGSKRKGKNTEPAGTELENLKLLYRKLVRDLHPDLHDENDGQATWRKQIWNRVQVAYQALDHHGLKRLYRLVLIRDERLDQLTLSEIAESKLWFKQEFDELSLEVKDLKKSPAWGFSRKKTYTSLQKKLEKPLAKELKLLELKLEEFKADRQLLEMMARSRSYAERPRRKSARSRRR